MRHLQRQPVTPESREGRRTSIFDRISMTTFVVLYVVVLVTHGDYGITWDESYPCHAP